MKITISGYDYRDEALAVQEVIANLLTSLGLTVDMEASYHGQHSAEDLVRSLGNVGLLVVLEVR